ncbi:hypothetical protein BJ322DRAFT_1112224 [Thelephora terrestris]|uniref:Fungal-type protein kinase domain-containing protein n=1 Tax=Thelephora terrestris TaxID=56493 RepID=A0A9P6H8K5_9AGAM|nr:hypothetical protein BJ322DRAFT_1112224 [Thelephora terrestris]
MNFALEHLSDIEVAGLPKFKSHIAFVPCNKGVLSNRDKAGSLFKPDLLIMTLQDTYKHHKLDGPDAPRLSEFTSIIAETSTDGSFSWEEVLLAIEVKRTRAPGWLPLTKSKLKGGAVREKNKWSDAEPSDSQRTISISSATVASFKHSASTAGLDTGAEALSTKWQRTGKDPIKKIMRSLAVQAGMYAAEKFSDSFSISHVLNLLIENDKFWVSWTNREGPILSSAHSFFDELPLMLVLLLVLQRFGRRQWGHISKLATENLPVKLHPVNADGNLGEEEVKVNFDPDDKAHLTWALLSRATAVVALGTTETKPGADKSSKEIDKEWLAFQKAQSAYKEAYAKKVKSHNLVLKVSWPETSRTEEWRTIEHARTLDGEEFWKVFWDCVACHYRLWVNGIHHSDISLKNLMCGFSETGVPVGVLNDFDLATWVGCSTMNNDRMGTIPFMVINLLNSGLKS